MLNDELLKKYNLDRNDPIIPVMELQLELQKRSFDKLEEKLSGLDDKAMKDGISTLSRVGMKLEEYSTALKNSFLKNVLVILIGITVTMLANWGLFKFLSSYPLKEKVRVISSDGVQKYSIDIRSSSKVEVNENEILITF